MEQYKPSFTGTKNSYPTIYLSLIELASNQEFDAQIKELVMMQLSFNRALKMWDKEAHQAVNADVKQLHWYE